MHTWNTLMTTNAQWENQQGKNVVQHVCVMHNTPLSGVVIASKCHNNDWVQTIKLSISTKSWVKKMLQIVANNIDKIQFLTLKPNFTNDLGSNLQIKCIVQQHNLQAMNMIHEQIVKVANFKW